MATVSYEAYLTEESEIADVSRLTIIVDIGTYRARIGCFTARSGTIMDLDTLRVVGVFAFIGIPRMFSR
ncbi:hypothetical protein DPMN_173851 [Dreissena polymorpha]|uniref:Uncharacterized protein n=1 Tax=Dreissena polymorpha TaxID=45954 RepID=A0A9D4E537_DREPO|nr:hypothetical protein DPMN_173851 [Dreissena polymorpha]